MQRRQLLKMAPLVALTAVSVKAGEVEAKMYELNKNKKYIFVFGNQDVTAENVVRFKDAAKACGIDGITIIGEPDLSIYELDAKSTA